ncbi:MAG: HAD-IA family hydrolase [Verrucomicrobiae bacterium]|nr:HAD-IA family hydrolase [Verrucomicrobiae bacterium]
MSNPETSPCPSARFPFDADRFEEWARRDESLRRPLALMERPGSGLRAISLDFFDTLVWRMVAKPTDVFLEAGRRLIADGTIPARWSAEDYGVLRRVAEGKARGREAGASQPREDIEFRAIAAEMARLFPDGEAVQATEQRCEEELCLPNPGMLGLVHLALRRGLEVWILSDFYLGPEALRGILAANGVDPSLFRLILTSGATGRCKGTGNLFRQALTERGLKPEQVMHVGDNFEADVLGARRAGVLGCHYRTAARPLAAVVERESMLQGGAAPVFSSTHLRYLAARQFGGATAEAFFGRAGAFLLGPVLSRFATWVVDEFREAGVSRVGALMREGEILGALIDREARNRGVTLSVAPLFANRRSTELASMGRLSADTLIDWLSRRTTLTIGEILGQFGIRPSAGRRVPIPLDQHADTRKRILDLAEYLFTPEIADRIEATSRQERSRIVEYLRPWMEGEGGLGLCDLGYNATAQKQICRILELEGIAKPVVGCYLVTCERAASRVLDGIDIRHFLGAFGHPPIHLQAFLRSPAFIEQCLNASVGTTVGYRRESGGGVRPVLEDSRFSPEFEGHQRAFKEGVLRYQELWHWARATKPALLGGGDAGSRRVLADVDVAQRPILARAAAFPLASELAHFGGIPLDDHYFAGGIKPLCGPSDRAVIRTRGYAKALGDQAVLWPQAALLAEAPHRTRDFFAHGRAVLLGASTLDPDTTAPVLSMPLLAPRDTGRLGEVLAHLAAAPGGGEIELVLGHRTADDATATTLRDFAAGRPHVRVAEVATGIPAGQFAGHAVDQTTAEWVLLADPSVPWASGMMAKAIAACDGAEAIGVCRLTETAIVVRRVACLEAGGLDGTGGFGAALERLHGRVCALGWSEAPGCLIGEGSAPTTSPEVGAGMTGERHPVTTSASQPNEVGTGGVSKPVRLHWIGTYLDHGSLSHVNRCLVGALARAEGAQVTMEGDARELKGHVDSGAFASLVPLLQRGQDDAVVTVRHAWPPDWSRPRTGKLAVIQPWEYGPLPRDWVAQAGQVDEFWVPSEYVRRCYVESGVPAAKVHVVPNGIDPERFRPDAPPLPLATKKAYKFLFVGGTIHRKGPDVLLKAYLDAFTDSDDVCLVIKDFGGSSVYAGQTLEARIRELQVRPGAPEILYLDAELPPESMPGLYTACDCLVHPYRGEGFGLPVLEAMACGLPVVVTDGGATDDFARPEIAYPLPAVQKRLGNRVGEMMLVDAVRLLEPDPAALSERMRWLVAHADRAREVGRAASCHVHLHWTWQRAAERVVERLRSMTEGVPAASGPGTVLAPKAIVLPPCARLGNLQGARDLLARRKPREAWEATLEALRLRPFHPEAYLLLAEIAQEVGDVPAARRCAQRARDLVPEWKPVRKFLKRLPQHGRARPQPWLAIPGEAARSRAHPTGQGGAGAASGADASEPSRPRLSVCLIVRNEEEFLPACLASVRSIADQIVVVDTGSTDRTVEIAGEFGAEVYSFEWCDDFSAARNAALERVTGDWVLALDADEELPQAEHGKLLAAIGRAGYIGYRLPLVNVGVEHEGVSYVPRLFRNAPGLFYISRVHEQIFSSILVRAEEWGLETDLGTAQLRHHGYANEVVRRRGKTERNLALLDLAVQEFPGDANLLMNLGLELVHAGRLDAGLARYAEALRALEDRPEQARVPELREALLTQYASHLLKAGRHDEILRLLQSPVARKAALTASLQYARALAFIGSRRYAEAVEPLRQCLATRKLPCLTPVLPEVLRDAPHRLLAQCLTRAGQPEAALAALLAGLKENAEATGIRLDLARLHAAQGRPVEALQLLNELISHGCNEVEVWRVGAEIALGNRDTIPFALEWTSEAIRHQPTAPVLMAQRGEALLLHGDPAGAHPWWVRAAANRDPSALAARTLCELAQGRSIGPLPTGDEPHISRAFLDWYRRLIELHADSPAIHAVNERINDLARHLPGAARLLESAMAEVA